MSKALVKIENVGQTFDTKQGRFTALRDIDLEIHSGEVVSLIGHSGCGKSTLLNLIAGLTRPTSGVLLCDGREIAGPGPERAVVFQNHSLLPWMSCFDNVYLAVERVFGGKEPRAQLRERTRAALDLVHMGHAMDKFPHEVSGGMKQRVGIARAFALSPKLLLLDEPFGMLDSLTRWELQEVLMEVWSRAQLTAIMITHDVDEAILLGDRVVMMTNGPEARVGKILEVDLPRPRSRRELLSHPRYYELRESLIQFLAECDHARH